MGGGRDTINNNALGEINTLEGESSTMLIIPPAFNRVGTEEAALGRYSSSNNLMTGMTGIGNAKTNTTPKLCTAPPHHFGSINSTLTILLLR